MTVVRYFKKVGSEWGLENELAARRHRFVCFVWCGLIFGKALGHLEVENKEPWRRCQRQEKKGRGITAEYRRRCKDAEVAGERHGAGTGEVASKGASPVRAGASRGLGGTHSVSQLYYYEERATKIHYWILGEGLSWLSLQKLLHKERWWRWGVHDQGFPVRPLFKIQFCF